MSKVGPAGFGYHPCQGTCDQTKNFPVSHWCPLCLAFLPLDYTKAIFHDPVGEIELSHLLEALPGRHAVDLQDVQLSGRAAQQVYAAVIRTQGLGGAQADIPHFGSHIDADGAGAGGNVGLPGIGHPFHGSDALNAHHHDAQVAVLVREELLEVVDVAAQLRSPENPPSGVCLGDAHHANPPTAKERLDHHVLTQCLECLHRSHEVLADAGLGDAQAGLLQQRQGVVLVDHFLDGVGGIDHPQASVRNLVRQSGCKIISGIRT